MKKIEKYSTWNSFVYFTFLFIIYFIIENWDDFKLGFSGGF